MTYFIEIFYDFRGYPLLRKNKWLRRRIWLVPNKAIEWSLKLVHSDPVSKPHASSLLYSELTSESEITEHLSFLRPELTKDNMMDMLIPFATFHTTRIESLDNKSYWFDCTQFPSEKYLIICAMHHQLGNDDREAVEEARLKFSKLAETIECGMSIPGKIISYLLSLEDHPALGILPSPTREALDEDFWSFEHPLRGIFFPSSSSKFIFVAKGPHPKGFGQKKPSRQDILERGKIINILSNRLF